VTDARAALASLQARVGQPSAGFGGAAVGTKAMTDAIIARL
jgi:hypothetical protein